MNIKTAKRRALGRRLARMRRAREDKMYKYGRLDGLMLGLLLALAFGIMAGAVWFVDQEKVVHREARHER